MALYLLHVGKLSCREGQWLTEMKDGDVVVHQRFTLVLRVLSDPTHRVIALTVSNFHVVVSSPDRDVGCLNS